MLRIDAQRLKQVALGLGDHRRRLGAEMRRAHKQVAAEVTPVARARASSESPMARRFAARITPRSTQAMARIAVSSPAIAAVVGTKRRTGWYAAEKYAGSQGRQFPMWEPGIPAPIAEALAVFAGRIDGMYLAAHERALAAVLPVRGGVS